jgi:putative transposase
MFIHEHKHEWPVEVQCAVLGISRAHYYVWKKKPRSRRAEADDKLKPLIRQAFEAHHGHYGSPRITYDVKAMGGRCTEKRVARLMKAMGLSARPPRSPRPFTTDSQHHFPVADNLLQQDFSAEKPNQKWVGDITYMPTTAGWGYLATVIDLYSRKIVGWSFGQTLHTDLICHALRRAITARRPSGPLIFHSDRGCQYASQQFRDELAQHQITQSMSRKGNCYDNAVAESFFHTLKNEWRWHHLLTPEQTEIALMRYMDGYYNRLRRHSSCHYLSPEQYELQCQVAA